MVERCKKGPQWVMSQELFYYHKLGHAQTKSCWKWIGYIREKGYGVFWNGKKNMRAHRFAYKAFVGCIPKGKVIDHICRNRSCVNPNHLRVVTAAENVMIGEGPCAANSRKTQCIHGHSLWKIEIDRRYDKPRRRCVICRRLKDIKRRKQIRPEGAA